MAASNDPLTPVKTKVLKIRRILFYLVKTVFNKLKSLIRSVLKFVGKLKSAAKQIIGVIGKTTFNKLIALQAKLEKAFAFAQKIGTAALKVADRILDLIKKAKDPKAVFKLVKQLVTQLVKKFRQVFHWVKELVSTLNPIAIFLAAVEKAVMVLRMILAWITDVSGVLTAVKKMRSMLTKALKELQKGLKEAVELMKTANKLGTA